MASQCVRDSFLGQILRQVCNFSCLKYPDELTALSSHRGNDRNSVSFKGAELILVDWYSEDVDENPQNWSQTKKAFVLLVIGSYSFVVYIAAPIYTPSVNAYMLEFDVGYAEASLGLALYILGYGAGPLLLSPLNEVPRIGRNLPYAVSFFLFCVINIPTAVAPNAIGSYFLRLFQGFFGSPCLATGGASIADVYSPDVLPHAMTSWVCCLFCAPAISTLISGFSVPILGCRFSMCEILIAADLVMALLLLLPETNPATILHRLAQRLRSLNQNSHHNFRSAPEITQPGDSFHTIIRQFLLIPSRITFLDPAILFLNCYTSLTYGIHYSFFEVFPLVYPKLYGFNLGEMGAAFLSIVVGTTISFVTYNYYIYRVFTPRMRSKGFAKPEELLISALFACFAPSIGLLLFGWTARAGVHWAVPTIWIVTYPAGVFILMQCVFMYISAYYPQYEASVFAATDFTRSAFACGAVIFSTPLYSNLGIGPGCSVLGGLAAGCILGIYLLFFFGEALRKRSKFAPK